MQRDASQRVGVRVAEGHRPRAEVALLAPAAARREAAQLADRMADGDPWREHIEGLEPRHLVTPHIPKGGRDGQDQAPLIHPRPRAASTSRTCRRDPSCKWSQSKMNIRSFAPSSPASAQYTTKVKHQFADSCRLAEPTAWSPTNPPGTPAPPARHRYGREEIAVLEKQGTLYAQDTTQVVYERRRIAAQPPHVKLKVKVRYMRLGRILLALLAPLVSVTPALRADLAATGTPAGADSLAGLLRAAVPMASVLAVETGHLNSGHVPRVSTAGFTPYVLVQAKVTWSPATEATLRLLTRQHNRAQLRC